MLASFSKLIYLLTLSPFRAEPGLWTSQKGLRVGAEKDGDNKTKTNERLPDKSAADFNLSNLMVYSSTSNHGDDGDYWEYPQSNVNEEDMQENIYRQGRESESAKQPGYLVGYAFASMYLSVAVPLALISSIFLSVSRTETLVVLYQLSTLSLWICIGSSFAMIFLPMDSGLKLPFLLTSAVTLLFGSTVLLIGFFVGILYLIFPPVPLHPNAVIIVASPMPVPVLPPFGRTMSFDKTLKSKSSLAQIRATASTPAPTTQTMTTSFMSSDLNSFSSFVVRSFQSLQNNLLTF